MRSSILVFVLCLGAAVPRVAPGGSIPMCETPPCTRDELGQFQQKVVRRLLRAQQARFEAAARGEDNVARRHDREFNRARELRAAVRQAIEHYDD